MKVCIVQLGRIGDLILLTPMIKSIKNKYPHCKIDFLVGPSNYYVIKDNPDINKIIINKKSPISIISTIYKLLSTKYDFWIDPKDHFSKESKIFAKIARAEQKIGFNLHEKIFDIELAQTNDDIHHVMIGLNSLASLGINLPDKPPRPILYSNKDSEDKINDFIKLNCLKEFILINISASNEIRMFDTDLWINFINVLIMKKKTVVLISAKNHKNIANEIVSKTGVVYFKSDAINDVFSIVHKTQIVISPDTSIVHIASAFNKPTLAFYSDSSENYSKFYPLSDTFEVVRAKKGDTGIKSIYLDEIMESFNKIIARLKPQL